MLLVLVVLASSACLTAAPAPTAGGVEVAGLSVEFPEPGSGRLRFTLTRAPAEVTVVRWNLLLGGRLFATGLEGHPTPTPLGLELDEPLRFRHLGWQEGARYLVVEVTGELTLGSEASRVPFRGRRELLLRGSPVLDAASD